VVHKNLSKISRVLGAVGALFCLALFIHEPSFPTPDKLFIFFLLLFMAYGQGWQLFKRLSPFLVVILVYESFRGLADQLNTHVNYSFAPHIDNFLFGNLPTIYLQNWLWHGHVQWYDIVFYIPYLFFFLVPFCLAVLIWKTRTSYYWQAVGGFSLLFLFAFLTFLVFPAAPPWMASDAHYIPHVTRISSHVWGSLGIHNFPSVYNHLSPNPVAAIPSLHAAVATLSSIYIFKLYGRRWGTASLLYPLILCFGVIYEAEHYFADVMIGVLYALIAYLAGPYLLRLLKRLQRLVLKSA
jgi:hypothetical protein